MAENETLEYRGHMKGAHGDWVTCLKIAVQNAETDDEVEYLVSGSRDKTLITWEITPKTDTDDDKEWGVPKKVLTGHNHFVEDISISQDGRYCLSASWDKTLRLYDLLRGGTTATFVDHTKDVLSCSFSAENRHIASGSRDKSVKIWNTVGDCKYTVVDDAHDDWVSCVRFSPEAKNPILATSSWDGQIKIWDSETMNLKSTFVGHTNAVTTLDFAQKSCYLASGGKDGNIILWNVNEEKFLKSKEHDASVNQVLFSPKKYWIVIATDNGILVWDLPKDKIIAKLVCPDDEDEANSDDESNADEGERKEKEKKDIPCLSMAWSKDGTHLYAGFADNTIRVFEVVKA